MRKLTQEEMIFGVRQLDPPPLSSIWEYRRRGIIVRYEVLEYHSSPSAPDVQVVQMLVLKPGKRRTIWKPLRALYRDFTRVPS